MSRPRCSPVVLLVLPLLAPCWFRAWPGPSAGCPRYDPALHVRPPTMKAVDGRSRAAGGRRRLPGPGGRLPPGQPRVPAPDRGGGPAGRGGHRRGDRDLIETEGTRYSVRLGAVARKVIEKYGDHFQAMTLWLTFNEASSTNAEAYEFTVRADVRGLGMTAAGQQRRLRIEGHAALAAEHEAGVVAGERRPPRELAPAPRDLGPGERPPLDGVHAFRDRRNGIMSDAMLGRDCSHYNRFLDSGGLGARRLRLEGQRQRQLHRRRAIRLPLRRPGSVRHGADGRPTSCRRSF